MIAPHSDITAIPTYKAQPAAGSPEKPDCIVPKFMSDKDEISAIDQTTGNLHPPSAPARLIILAGLFGGAAVVLISFFFQGPILNHDHLAGSLIAPFAVGALLAAGLVYHRHHSHWLLRARLALERQHLAEQKEENGRLENLVESRTEELNLRQARFLDFISAGADRVWETDENHRYTFVSNAGPNSGRFASEDVLGKRRWELDEDSAQAPHWTAYREILESHEPFEDFEYSRWRDDGTEHRIRTSAVPILDEAGAFKGYRGVNREISREFTETKLAEEQARLAQLRLFEALEQVDAGIALWNANGGFVHCNSYYHDLNGPFADFLVPGAAATDFFLRLLNKKWITLTEGQAYQSAENVVEQMWSDQMDLDYQLQDGRWMRLHRQRLPDGFTIALHTDITDHKIAEKTNNPAPN